MIWRLWSFLAGIPVGCLALRAVGDAAGGVPSLAAAFAGGLLLLAAGEWIARSRGGAGAPLACAASAGLVALPALLAARLVLPPGPRTWLVVQLLLLLLAFHRAGRATAAGVAGRPLRGGASWRAALRPLGCAASWLAAGSVGVVGLGILSAAAGGAGPVPAEGRAEAVLDADARVATRRLPVCRDAAEIRVLLDRGARPRLGPNGAQLWFDAPGPADRRQVHRLALAGGEVRCVTCEEPGNNLRPHPGAAGLLFETDRHADARDPSNTELYLVRGSGGSRDPSRRLTRSPGPDDHGLLEPTAGRVVWSRRDGGGYEVVWASLRSAHGALLLGTASPLVRGGAEWLAPVQWSPDARALVLRGGNPFAAGTARALDFASGESRLLARDLAPGGVAFSADGGLVALAGTRRAHLAGRLPASLGAVLAPLAGRLERGGALHRETRLRIGPVAGPLREIPLPGLERWGEPTGLALSADGVVVYLAQRAGDGRERLVEIRRDCH